MKPAGLQSKNPVSPSPWKLRKLGKMRNWGHLAMACLVAVLAWAGCQAQVTKVPPGGEQDLSLPGGATNCQGIKCLSTTMVCCPGEDCVDTTNNPNHCGACGKSCNSGEICDNSRCVCSVGNMVCNNALFSRRNMGAMKATPKHAAMGRMYEAARRLGKLDENELASMARLLNQSAQCVNNWGRRGPSKQARLQFQRDLGVSATWIETGAVSEAVLYLSSKAGENITGISLPIDLGAAAK